MLNPGDGPESLRERLAAELIAAQAPQRKAQRMLNGPALDLARVTRLAATTCSRLDAARGDR